MIAGYCFPLSCSSPYVLQSAQFYVMKRKGNALTSSQPPKKNPAEEQATPSNGAQTAKAKQANASQAQASQNATPQAQVNNAASLRKALNQCMMRDRFRLSKRISGAKKSKKMKRVTLYLMTSH